MNKLILIYGIIILPLTVHSQKGVDIKSKQKEKMSNEVKKEALEQLELDIQIGFETEDELIESISEMFYDVENFDEKWFKDTVKERISKRTKESSTWTKPTDFEKLVRCFDTLTAMKIVALHNAGYTKQDAIAECEQTIEELEEFNINMIGYCYYDEQDIGGAIESNVLYIGFDSIDSKDIDAINIGKTIVQVLTNSNFDIDWNGNIDTRIEIKNFNWKKLPDNDIWGVERIKKILTK